MRVFLLAVPIAFASSAPACAGATQIVVEIRSEVDCAKNAEVTVTEGPLDGLDTLPPATTKTTCDDPTKPLSKIGSVVLVPRDDKSALVTFRVATREDGAPVERCGAPGSDQSACITSRRRIAFRPHETENVIVDLRLVCAGVKCPNDQTCVSGKCVGIDNVCAGGACDESSLPGATDEPPVLPAIGRDRVLVVYNASWTDDGDHDGVQDSEQVARYYADRRRIPADHVIGVPATTSPPLSFANYRALVADPIVAALQAIDPAKIDTIVTVYGVPTGIEETPTPGAEGAIDNYLMGLEGMTAAGTRDFAKNPYFVPAAGITGDVVPFDHARFSFNGKPMYLVTRIDGPRSLDGALDLVDQAIYAERYLGTQPGQQNGTLYFDTIVPRIPKPTFATDPNVTSGDLTSTTAADDNLLYAADAVGPLGMPVKVEDTEKTIGDPAALFADGSSAAAAPRALLYAGHDSYGHYTDGFDWLPGSVGNDIDSGALYYYAVHGPSVWWGWNALLRGATCIAGVVGDDGEAAYPRPATLLVGLARGHTFAESFAASIPAIGWTPMAIGDPLYAPFRTDKPRLRDARAPQITGALRFARDGADVVVSLLVDDAKAPELAQASIAFGTTDALGTTATSGRGWFRRLTVRLPGVAAGTLVHYVLTLVDPAANVTTLPPALTVAP